MALAALAVAVLPAAASGAPVVVAWGNNTYGQLGDGTTTAKASPVEVKGLGKVTAVAAGSAADSFALGRDGTVVAWGNEEGGALGNGVLGNRGAHTTAPVPVTGLTKVKEIATGGLHSLALLRDGTVMTWGSSDLGNGSSKGSTVPVPVEGLSGVTALATGTEFSLVLLSDGTVEAWGQDDEGQLGDGSCCHTYAPAPVPGLSGVVEIAAGAEHALARLADGTVMAWGSNRAGQLGVPAGECPERCRTPHPSTPSGVAQVKALNGTSLARLGDGTVLSWGQNGGGALGRGQVTVGTGTPRPVVAVEGAQALATGSGGGVSGLAVLSSGGLMAWGDDSAGELGNGIFSAEEFEGDFAGPVRGIGEVTAVSSGSAFNLALGAPGFEAPPAPTVASVSGGRGPVSCGTRIKLRGEHLAGARAVYFDEHPLHPSFYSEIYGKDEVPPRAASFTVNSDSSLWVVTPAVAEARPSDVRVITSGGPNHVARSDRFSFYPTVTSIEPSSGPSAAETEVTITGKGFSTGFTGTASGTEPDTEVRFGSARSRTVHCPSPTSCTAIAPAHEPGTVAVSVIANKVPSARNGALQFTYTP